MIVPSDRNTLLDKLLGRSAVSTLNADATSLAILTLLALGTFTAGVHILAWQICVVGVIMAVGVPASAWLERSALLLGVGALVLLGVGLALWLYIRQGLVRRS